MGFKLTAYVPEKAAPSVSMKEIEVPTELAADLESAYQAWTGNHAFVIQGDFDSAAEAKTFFDTAHYWAYHRTAGRVRIRKVTAVQNSELVQVFRICDLPDERETAANRVANLRSALNKLLKDAGSPEDIAAAEAKVADAIVKAVSLGVTVKGA